MNTWIVKLRPEDLDCLGPLRTLPEIWLASSAEALWMKCHAEKKPAFAIRKLPAERSWRLLGELLFEEGRETPSARLPQLDWKPIASQIKIQMPTAAMPAHLDREQQKFDFALLRSQKEQPLAAVLCDLNTWEKHRAESSTARLARLQVAISSRSEALLIGTPLPSIEGMTYWQQGNLLFPAGFELEIPAMGELIARKFDPLSDHFLLFAEDGHFEKVNKRDFIPAQLLPISREFKH